MLFKKPGMRGGLPELFGFAFGPVHDRAELMMSHCGQDLNKEWAKYMTNKILANSIEFKLHVCDMTKQVLSALECLHLVGFCHWDLKLDNICYKEGYYYLIDFALAQRINSPHKKKSMSFKGNSMFASMRKFDMNSVAYPNDDIESLLYLVCYCYSEFYLPWLKDYMK